MLHLIIQTTSGLATVVFTDYLECTIEVQRLEYELPQQSHECTIDQGVQHYTVEEVKHEDTVTERQRAYELPGQPAIYTIESPAFEIDPLHQHTIAGGITCFEINEGCNRQTITQGKLHYTLSE